MLRVQESERATQRRRGRPWSHVDDQFIRDNWQARSASDIAAILDRDIAGVSRRAKLLRLNAKCTRWTLAEDAFLRQHYRTRPTAWVARQLSRTAPQCVQRASRLGLLSPKRGAAARRG